MFRGWICGVYMYVSKPWQQMSNDDGNCLSVGVLCVCYCAGMTLHSCALLEALYMAIGLQAREEDVEEPESKEQQWGKDFGDAWAS